MTSGARVLVVDDDDIILSIISNILRRNKYVIEKCYSGEDALKRISVNDYDLVLLDVHMGSGLDGYETCKLMLKKKPDMPIILVTANQDDESVNRGFESGSSDYIKKPVSRLELLARVKNTITLKRSEKRNLHLIDILRKDLITAANIQRTMLPKWVKIDGDMIFSSYYEASENVGGDLFDQFKLDDQKYVVYIGDVSGHGVQAALLMAAIKSSIKHLIEAYKDDKSLAYLFTKLNDRLTNDFFFQNNYLTLMMGVVDLQENEFRFLNAGHPPLMRINPNEGIMQVHDEKGSLPLGWMKHIEYEDEEIEHIPLNENDIYLMFTDGIYECTNKENSQLGMDGLKTLLQDKLDIDSCITIPNKIKQYLTDNNFETNSDDFTLFSFQINSSSKSLRKPMKSRSSYSRHYTFVLMSVLKDVGEAAQMCEKLIYDWTTNKSLAAKVELIVDEFLNNIIKYGYSYNDDAEIVIGFNMVPNMLTIWFWDKGIEWNPSKGEYNVHNPYNFEQDGFDLSGRGIKIIQSISNHFVRNRFGIINETKVELSL